MKYLSALISAGSGKMGGLVMSRNRSGAYIRRRVQPVNPNTDLQQAVRTQFGANTVAWKALSDEQRGSWSTYASLTPVKDRLGQTILLSGQQWYMKLNGIRHSIGLAAASTAPVTPGFGSLGVEPLVALDDTPLVTLTVGSGATAPAVGSVLGVFVGPAISAGVTFYRGPYQLQGPLTLTTSPGTIATPPGYNSIPFVEASRIPYRINGVTSTADGQRPIQVVAGIAIVAAGT